MRRRREELQRRLKERRDERRRRHGRLAVLLLLLLGLLVLLCCRGCPTPPPPPDATEPSSAVSSAVEGDAPPEEPDLSGRIDTTERPRLPPTPPGPLPWLEALRLQVGARSPQLASCFVGVGHPGSFRFSGEVSPTTGHITAATLEPVATDTLLSAEQRACALEVLTVPPYRLDGASDASPRQVSWVVEF